MVEEPCPSLQPVTEMVKNCPHSFVPSFSSDSEGDCGDKDEQCRPVFARISVWPAQGRVLL